MNRLVVNLKLIWCNITQHKIYTLFCVFGTMLTFIFVVIITQITHVLLGNTEPALEADRIVYVPDILENDAGKIIKGINKRDIQTLVSNLKDEVHYTCSHFEATTVIVNGQYKDQGIYFIDENYWKVFQFEFVQGHPFTESEMEMPCVIVNEHFAKKNFPKGDALDKEVQFQRRTYKITGVVADVSFFAQEGKASFWAPEKFNKQIPTGNDWVETYILFPEKMEHEVIVNRVTNAFKLFTKMYNVDESTTLKQIRTVDEALIVKYGGDLLMVGISGILFILFIIPILNIVLLNVANTNTRSSEIGLKRALGADNKSAFLSILAENFLLVFIGTILGIIFTLPVCQLIDKILFLSIISGEMTILASLNWKIIFMGVLPLSLLFSLLSGGIPAYWMVKRSIIDMLKGGIKC